MNNLIERPVYNYKNVFWQIIMGDIKANFILETRFTISFYDINPHADIHILVIPKGPYTNFLEFHNFALVDEIIDFYSHITAIATKFGFDQSGYKLIINTGVDGGQEVPHYHAHILKGLKKEKNKTP